MAFLKLATICALLIIVMFDVVRSQHISDVQRLLSDKAKNYTDKVLRPLYDQSKALDIYVGFDLISIQEFDEREGRVTVTGILYNAWHDEFFEWDPLDYGGTTYVIVDTTYLWVPIMTLTNAVGEIDKVSEDWHTVSITYDGVVQYRGGGIFSFSCDIDVTYYPWDQQKCHLSFIPWGYSIEQIKIIQFSDSVFRTYFTENGAWTFADSSTGLLQNAVNFFFELVLERQPRFVVINVIVPMMCMSFLNILVFLIPFECGERMSYSLTVLLAIAVFLTLVGDNLPKTSDPMSLLSYYLLAVLIVSVCITLATICSLRLYHSDENERINPFWKTIAYSCGKCRCDRNPRKRRNRQTHSESVSVKHGQVYNGDTNFNHAFFPNYGRFKVWSVNNSLAMSNITSNGHVIYSQTKENRKCSQINGWQTGKMERNKTDLTWKDVSVAVDRIFFVSFILVIVVLTLIFTLYSSKKA